MTRNITTVRAAGALVWRQQHGVVEVALVHRPRYDDWSWPKGKLDPGEDFPQAAIREVLEETGYLVRLGIPLPQVEHDLGHHQHKLVKYWAAQVIGGEGELLNEIDAVEWLTLPKARKRLTYPRDLAPLDALEAALDRGELNTWPLLLVRHAHAIARSAYRGPKDWHRPLSERGKNRAKALVPVLNAWGLETVITSDSTRCVQTVKPFCEAIGLPIHKKGSLSEEKFEIAPHKAVRQLDKLMAAGAPAALCTHRPLIPMLVSRIAEHTVTGDAARRTLGSIRSRGMDKGEVLVCQMVGIGSTARVVSAERVRTPEVQR